MRAKDHTQRMLDWWIAANVHQVDLMVKRPEGATILHANIAIKIIPLPWLRAENAHGGDIYIRPARHHLWPLLFLDDVHPKMAIKIANKYAILIVHTSPQGGCHLWLKITEPLCEKKRGQAQRYLSQLVRSDPASTSGERFGRLAGMKNWKRDGVWVNIFQSVPDAAVPWNPTPALKEKPVCANDAEDRKSTAPVRQHPIQRLSDQSQSGQEWGWVRGALEAGIPPEKIFIQLLQRARPRRGKDAERYARRTVKRAMQKFG